MTQPFSSIVDAIKTLKAGKMVILIDAEDRENEGDLVVAADYATPESINFMARFGRGLICLSMDEALVDKLHLPMMAHQNRSPFGTAFTVSIEAASGVSTGISAQDRARTIKVAIDAQSGPRDVISPGHIFPLRAMNGGVLARKGQTEGSVDLARLAGLTPAAVICEIINDDGTMSRRDDLEQFSKRHDIPMVTIKDLIHYRMMHEVLLTEEACVPIAIEHPGQWMMHVFHNQLDTLEHFALSQMPSDPAQIPTVRIHSECITGDVFGSHRCDCGAQLKHALDVIQKEGGVLIYLRQEGRGIGLANKIKAYGLQTQGLDTVEANEALGLPVDAREYSIAYQILKHMGIQRIKLLTNNPKKIEAMLDFGVDVVERIPSLSVATSSNRNYLKTKKNKLGHFLDLGGDYETH